jgi:hypothetical protein
MIERATYLIGRSDHARSSSLLKPKEGFSEHLRQRQISVHQDPPRIQETFCKAPLFYLEQQSIDQFCGAAFPVKADAPGTATAPKNARAELNPDTTHPMHRNRPIGRYSLRSWSLGVSGVLNITTGHRWKYQGPMLR